MADTSQFTIGAEASCSDGPAGKVSRVIVDPVAEKVTHLVIEPGRRRDSGRLVPLDLIESAAGGVRLRCTRAEFGKLDPAEESQFLPATSSYEDYGYGAGEVGYWPYYRLGGGMGVAGLGLGGGMGVGGGTPARTVTSDTVPPGEVDVCRGDTVHATDGDIGRVAGLVIDPRSGHVTHVLLQEATCGAARRSPSRSAGWPAPSAASSSRSPSIRCGTCRRQTSTTRTAVPGVPDQRPAGTAATARSGEGF